MRIFKKTWGWLFLTFALILFSSSFFTKASEINIINPPLPPPSFSLVGKISEGLDLLKNSGPLQYEFKTQQLKNGKTVVTSELARRQIALALFNTQTGEVFEHRVWVMENEIKNYKKTKQLTLVPVSSNAQLNIQPKLWNSFNTFYEVIDQPEFVVVANKYLVESRYYQNLPEIAKTKYSEILYVPYSDALHQPEIITAGQAYIDRQAAAAFAQINSSGVVAKPVNPEFIKNIILVEHVDPDGFALSSDSGKMLVERVLTIIGANQERAYRYTGSPAGASGLAQFIAPTYFELVKKYPEIRLNKDYNLGMADHVNAIKAMFLFFDNYGRQLASNVTRPDILTQLGITDEMLAAAYNGGPRRVSSSINKFGLAWLEGQFDLPKAKRVLASETLSYLKKFLAIRQLALP